MGVCWVLGVEPGQFIKCLHLFFFYHWCWFPKDFLLVVLKGDERSSIQGSFCSVLICRIKATNSMRKINLYCIRPTYWEWCAQTSGRSMICVSPLVSLSLPHPALQIWIERGETTQIPNLTGLFVAWYSSTTMMAAISHVEEKQMEVCLCQTTAASMGLLGAASALLLVQNQVAPCRAFRPCSSIRIWWPPPLSLPPTGPEQMEVGCWIRWQKPLPGPTSHMGLILSSLIQFLPLLTFSMPWKHPSSENTLVDSGTAGASVVLSWDAEAGHSLAPAQLSFLSKCHVCAL